jgi:NAD(P)H-hydrate epimerase
VILNRQQLREIDERATREYGIPSIILMENAGRSIAEYLLSMSIQGQIVICCGKGNNAGDGFVVARHLDNHGVAVKVLIFTDPDQLVGDAKVNFEIILKSKIPVLILNNKNISELSQELEKSNWIVDALFGTGLKGPIQGPYDQVIHYINHANKKVLSIDIPSGIDCDTGEELGHAIKAHDTVTLVAAKKGFDEANSKYFLGQLHIVGIGIPRVLLEQYEE